MTRLLFASSRAKSAPSNAPPDTKIMLSSDMAAVKEPYGSVLVVLGSEPVILSVLRQ